ncbi:tetratricopeptide repeat protein [Agrobacterium tumefaciens]|uniref:tetratricopeptide repeat protein n=1 Tax=Agrobacterium tumefaciens TaxID=358 RepID=UPI0021D1FD5B|nr:tetratricopeptide repeat protein [Agrobacterium tumefaciens]UXT97976.1 tetratricopeptide repeat protein [Agrobacterium tumefaciens]
MERHKQTRAQLARILKSKTFENSERLRKFLSYVVIETIEGREDKIKSYSIGIEVLNRSSDFDTAHDGIVRTTANRLRAALEKYYRSEGRNDPTIISLPKGRYVPTFTDNVSERDKASPDDEEPAVGIAGPSGNKKPGLLSNVVRVAYRRTAGVLFVALLLLAGWLFLAGHTPAVREPPIILIPETTALTDDELAVIFARGLPVRLSSAMAYYDVNGVVRTKDFTEAHRYAAGVSNLHSVYVVTSEVGTEAQGLAVHWQLVDARTGVVLWSSRIVGKSEERFVDTMVQELVGENAAIRSAEQRSLPVEPVAGYVCVTHSLNKLTTMSDADRQWMSDCLADTVGMQPDYAGAWALLALVAIEDSVAAADRGDRKGSQLKLEEAWRGYQNAQRLAPASWLTLRARTMVEFQAEDEKGFQASAAKALAVLPENARERVLIASRLFAVGDYGQAEAIIKTTIELMPVPQPSDYTFLAASFYRRGAFDDALKVLQNQQVADSAFYWCLLAAIAGQRDDASLAKTALQSLEQRRPGFSHILETDLRNRHFRNEFITKLLSDFNKARLLYPSTAHGASGSPESGAL